MYLAFIEGLIKCMVYFRLPTVGGGFNIRISAVAEEDQEHETNAALLQNLILTRKAYTETYT